MRGLIQGEYKMINLFSFFHITQYTVRGNMCFSPCMYFLLIRYQSHPLMYLERKWDLDMRESGSASLVLNIEGSGKSSWEVSLRIV